MFHFVFVLEINSAYSVKPSLRWENRHTDAGYEGDWVVRGLACSSLSGGTKRKSERPREGSMPCLSAPRLPSRGHSFSLRPHYPWASLEQAMRGQNLKVGQGGEALVKHAHKKKNARVRFLYVRNIPYIKSY